MSYRDLFASEVEPLPGAGYELEIERFSTHSFRTGLRALRIRFRVRWAPAGRRGGVGRVVEEVFPLEGGASYLGDELAAACGVESDVLTCSPERIAGVRVRADLVLENVHDEQRLRVRHVRSLRGRQTMEVKS